VFAGSVLVNMPNMKTHHGDALASCTALSLQRNLPPRFTNQEDGEYQNDFAPKLYPKAVFEAPGAYSDYMVASYDLSQELYRAGYSDIESFRPRIKEMGSFVAALETYVSGLENNASSFMGALQVIDRDVRHKSILMGINLDRCSKAMQKMAVRAGPFSDLPFIAPDVNEKPDLSRTSFDYNLK